MLKVGIFTVAMLLVAAMLVVVFGEFRFASANSYHATFSEASRLKAGQDVRIARRSGGQGPRREAQRRQHR